MTNFSMNSGFENLKLKFKKYKVNTALAGVRNHDYESFRSNGTTGYSSNMITSTGNRYK